MTVNELRDLLATLPKRFDDTEVMVTGTVRGLQHVSIVTLDRRAWPDDDLPHGRRARKLRISGGGYSGRLWMEEPPDWRLEGWWPKEAADIGLVDA